MRAMGVSAQSPGELLELLRAQNGQHQWIEQQREAENARQMLREAIETDPSYLAAKEMAYEKMYADDLAAIKEVFPEVTASHVSQLGEVYLSLMGAGLGDVVAAYAAARAVKERTTKPPPQSGRYRALNRKFSLWLPKNRLRSFSENSIAFPGKNSN